MQQIFQHVPTTLAKRIASRHGQRIGAIVVYGSVARGKAQWSADVDRRSDIDVLIVTDHEDVIREGVLDLQTDLDLENGTVTNVIYRSPTDLVLLYRMGDPLIVSILREGNVLYDTGAYRRLRRRLLGQIAAATR